MEQIALRSIAADIGRMATQFTVSRNEDESRNLYHFQSLYSIIYGSTKQCSESECVDYDREDADSVVDCTMSLDVDGDSGDSNSVICYSDFAQPEARKKSNATSDSATCARKRPHPGAAMYHIKFKPEWKKEFPWITSASDPYR